MRRNPVFSRSTRLRVPSGVMAMIISSAHRSWRPMASAMPTALRRSTAMPPRRRNSPAMGQRNRLCLPSQWICMSRASMATTPTMKSQLEVWGPTPRMSLAAAGRSPSMRQRARRRAARARRTTIAGRRARWPSGMRKCSIGPPASVFPGGEEAHFRVALRGEAEVHPGRRQVGEMAAAVDGEVVAGLVLEFLDVLGGALHPAGGVDVDGVVEGIDPVLVLEAIGHHVELQLPHRPHHHVVAVDGEEHLGGALLRQLLQTLVELLGLEGIAHADAAEQFRREVGHAGELAILPVGEGVADLDGTVV